MGMPTLAGVDKALLAQERTFRCFHLFSGIAGRKLKGQKRAEAEMPILAGSAKKRKDAIMRLFESENWGSGFLSDG